MCLPAHPGRNAAPAAIESLPVETLAGDPTESDGRELIANDCSTCPSLAHLFAPDGERAPPNRQRERYAWLRRQQQPASPSGIRSASGPGR